MKLDAFVLYWFLIYSHVFSCLILALNLCFSLYGGALLYALNVR